MESAAVLRSFNCTISHGRSVLERLGTVHLHNGTFPTSSKSHIQGFTFGGKLVSSPKKWEGTLVSCMKTAETAVTTKSNDGHSQGLLERNSLRCATFPNGFEALVLEVCDETEVAELKLKVGDFEMHLKRNVGAMKAPMPVISSTPPPPIPTKPTIESAPAAPPSSPSTEKINPFTNVPVEKSAKLTALEASGSSGYVIVSSSIVGSFRRGRTLKGKKQPPICKEGDVIKEGQVIGFLDQFGTELPVKSDVSGEVLKLLFDDGEAVGYGDPLIAVLPSFHGIE
uniref:Lipoyl-binding domain-containing protein n=1 Tax=Davidia involucrata TaxID=16924 RepID=A0A5B6ZVS2_DAVIN